MFDSICLRQQRTLVGSEPIDVGFLAECLLFYGKVRLVADRGMLGQLLTVCGPSQVLTLVESDRLQIAYLENSLGVRTENTGTPLELHQPVSYEIVGMHRLQDVAPSLFEEVIGRSGKARRMAVRFQRRVRRNAYDEQLVLDVREDYLNRPLMRDAAETILQVLAPEYERPVNLEFVIEPKDKWLVVSTNINFSKANHSHHRYYPPEISSLTPAFLMSTVLNGLMLRLHPLRFL